MLVNPATPLSAATTWSMVVLWAPKRKTPLPVVFSGLTRSCEASHREVAEADAVDRADRVAVGVELADDAHAESLGGARVSTYAVFWSGWEGSWVFPQASQQGPVCRLSTWVLVGFLVRLGGDVPRASHHPCRVRCEPQGWAGSPRR